MWRTAGGGMGLVCCWEMEKYDLDEWIVTDVIMFMSHFIVQIEGLDGRRGFYSAFATVGVE